MEQKWRVRPFRDGDEKEIFELYKIVYSARQYDPEKWLKWWQWKYKCNPAGKSIIWLAEDKGKIVGQYAIIPVFIKIDSDIVTGAQSVDTMTHPDYRHQGIFETLAKAVYKEATTKDINIIYGFPNEFSYPGFIKKLDWDVMPYMQIMVKPFNWRNILKRKIENELPRIPLALGAGLIFNKIFLRTQKPPNIEGLTITRITSFEKRFDEFWLSVCDHSKIMVVRKRDYLNWRYSTPDTNYSIFVAEKDLKICGYAVLQQKIRVGVNTSTIFDLMAQTEDIMHCLISRTIEESQKESDMVFYSAITNDIYYRIFKRNGFIPLIFIKSGHFCVYPHVASSSKEFLTNPKNWIVQIGDSDAT